MMAGEEEMVVDKMLHRGCKIGVPAGIPTVKGTAIVGDSLVLLHFFGSDPKLRSMVPYHRFPLQCLHHLHWS